MKIIQAMGLERKLKAYKVLLPNMKYLHKLWRIPVYSKKLVQCQTKFNSTFNVGKKKRKIKQILSIMDLWFFSRENNYRSFFFSFSFVCFSRYKEAIR